MNVVAVTAETCANHFAPNSGQLAITSLPMLIIFTGRMPFLPPNQRCQTAESDIITPGVLWETFVVPDLSWIVLQKYSGDGITAIFLDVMDLPQWLG